MYVKPILWILLFISVQEVSPEEYNYYEETYEDPQPLNCSTTESIKGGHVTYSQGGLEGSVLTYHCGAARYPFPLSYRLCSADGEWSPMRLTNGRQISRATCKDMLCPAQLQLDHGDIWPRVQWSRVETTQSFSCQEGFTLQGSAQRNCTLSGEWTGTTPVCDNHADDCSDPGIPPGSQRSAGRFYTGEKVIYRCQTGLDLLGSAERVCLENREWSGSTPRCQGPNMFDSPSIVAAALAGSLAGVMDVFSPDHKKKGSGESFARTFRVSKGSRMNVYILLDTSGSITKQDFELSRKATIALIRKLDSYEVMLKFHVLSFATKAIDIVNIQDLDSGSIEDVIWKLEEFDYNSHEHNTGTNLHAALHRVTEMISFFKQNSAKNHFNETQNILVIETDGNSNTGKNPQNAVAQIRSLLGYQETSSDHTDETMLDVYVFGIGERVNKIQLNSLASKKRDEQHVFAVKDFETLGKVFNSIISDKSVTMCGVAQEWEKDEMTFTRPWHVTVEMVTRSKATRLKPCVGSIVSQNWVLTAAHCFARASTETPQQVHVGHGEGTVVSKRVIMHPKYNVRALEHRNVSEFYDYDVALVQVNKSIPLSWKARPICLPCTVPASRAMKRVNSTCQEHRKELLSQEETAAFFIHKSTERKETYIHTESQRPSCVEKAMQTLKEPTNVTVDEYIPDRFLCAGGSSGYKYAITCKGDSGGSLFLQKNKRYFQVGVVSWGTTNVCEGTKQKYSSDNPPPEARDFHIDLFKIMPWLKQHLGEEIQFLPEVN
ncbi:LOW QUALITY PROTEIN: complement C2 [Cottoperca gobio]|uniref:C3/C5 convertase n=1 Tax=Cottoperca gobio TaxID=56716 RepID=A0A6J2QWN2_COTGO|nr:LOW QUALITY PROTEIN: complement C2-like [Cottoperca gobio]